MPRALRDACDADGQRRSSVAVSAQNSEKDRPDLVKANCSTPSRGSRTATILYGRIRTTTEDPPGESKLCLSEKSEYMVSTFSANGCTAVQL